MKQQQNPFQHSILSYATVSPKAENQDGGVVLGEGGIQAVFIADGLGSCANGGTAARSVLSFVSELAVDRERAGLTLDRAAIISFFCQARQMLIHMRQNESDLQGLDLGGSFATTLVCVFETDDRFIFAYTGNGAIWHIRANFSAFPAAFPYPWNACNYLNPHTLPENGREVLYRLIADDQDGDSCVPTVLELAKDAREGDIVMICTDGIYSADQVRSGTNELGVWLKYPTQMMRFFERLRSFLVTGDPKGDGDCRRMLEEYLDGLLPELDDDATVGLLITAAALNYHDRNHEDDFGKEI